MQHSRREGHGQSIGIQAAGATCAFGLLSARREVVGVLVGWCSESAACPLPRHLRGAISQSTSMVVPNAHARQAHNHHTHPHAIHSPAPVRIAESALAERMCRCPPWSPSVAFRACWRQVGPASHFSFTCFLRCICSVLLRASSARVDRYNASVQLCSLVSFYSPRPHPRSRQQRQQCAAHDDERAAFGPAQEAAG
jgi:hypothetical protein